MTCKPLPIFFFKSQPHLYGTSKDGPRRCLIQVNTANAPHHPFFLYVNGLNCGAGGRGRFLFERVLILSKFFRHIVLSLCADAVYSMNEQLKREVAQLEGEIRHQQYVHERTQDVNRNSYGNPVRWPPNSPRRDVWRGRFTRLLPRKKKKVIKKKNFSEIQWKAVLTVFLPPPLESINLAQATRNVWGRGVCEVLLM